MKYLVIISSIIIAIVVAIITLVIVLLDLITSPLQKLIFKRSAMLMELFKNLIDKLNPDKKRD